MTNLDRKFKVAPLIGKMPQVCRNDLDEILRQCYQFLERSDWKDSNLPTTFEHVLLTGATGFIGRYVLCALLGQESKLTVYCLVRSENDEHGKARLLEALSQCELYDESMQTRIKVVTGDVKEAFLGMPRTDFEQLGETLDAVYHLAADVGLTSSYQAIRYSNIFSVRNIVELCLSGRKKHLFYASTMGVFPEYFCNFTKEFAERYIEDQQQPNLEEMKRIFPLGFSGYPWSKLITEQILLSLQQAGLNVAIFRLPLTGNSSSGFTQANFLEARILAAMVDVGAGPDFMSTVSCRETVDTLGKLLVDISLNPHRLYTLYHCCDANPVVHDIDLADYGLYLKKITFSDFKRRCLALGKSSPLYGYWSLLDHFAPWWFAQKGRQHTMPVSEHAYRVDCRHPVKWTGMMTVFSRAKKWVVDNRHDWPYFVPDSRLDYDALVGQARSYAERYEVPFSEAYPDWILQGLERIVSEANAPHARVKPDSIDSLVFEFSRRLRTNALLARERKLVPAISSETISQPVFIVGINRTGTTFLQNLLSKDSGFWTIKTFELVEQALEPGEWTTDPDTCMSAVERDGRRLKRAEDVLAARDVIDRVAGIHPINIEGPGEDFPLLMLTFASWDTIFRFNLPNYHDWLKTTDMQTVYDFHLSVMRHFNWRRKKWSDTVSGQWLLKMPFHLINLDALIKTYPDALFIQTHRNPIRFVASWCSLVSTARSVQSLPLPAETIGAEQLSFMHWMLDKAMDFRAKHPDLEHRWVDISYDELIADPIAMVQSIYKHFGWDFSADALDRMQSWLSAQQKIRKNESRHRYSLENYGLEEAKVNAAFSRYFDFSAKSGICLKGA